MIRFIAGTVLIVATLAGALMLEGISPLGYFGITMFIIVAFVPLFASLAVWKWKDLLNAWKGAFSKSKAENASTSIRVWTFYEKSFYTAGFLGTLVGLIYVLSILPNGQPEAGWSDIGKKVAVCFDGILYALLLGLFARILQARVEEKKE